MCCLNRQRANIVFSSILQHGQVLDPSAVSQRERVFERDGVLRWADGATVGHCKIGVSLQELLSRIGRTHKRTGSLDVRAVQLSELLDVFADEAYVLWFDPSDYEALVVLKEGCAPADQLRAWAHALLLGSQLRGRNPGGKLDDMNTSRAKDPLADLRRTLEVVRGVFAQYSEMLIDKGWDLDVGALETRPGMRAEIESRRKN